MPNIDEAAAERFVITASMMLALNIPPLAERDKVTVTFSYGPDGQTGGDDLSDYVAEHDVDIIHFDFRAGDERAGPVNIALCENRNGAIFTWLACDLWSPEDERFLLVIPRGQDFGFAFDGYALIRVTEGPTGILLREGVARAKKSVMSAVSRMPSHMRVSNNDSSDRRRTH